MSIGSTVSIRRRALSWPLFGLTLGTLIFAARAAQAAAPVLPTSGKVVAGSASIGAPTAGSLVINQSSAKAIIDWSGFSIGSGGKVVFDNGSGATLNRVTGRLVSSLDGLLSGTGSVYVINPNGLIVGRNGVVNVGGTFVASTLDMPDAGFLKGGDLSFSGASSAAVVNYGRIGALGGDVALIAARVFNAGSISAANGDAGLLSGTRVVLTDASLDDGRFSVELGAKGSSVTNSGLIAAADVELRAENGNVYALAGNTAGTIRATGVKSGGGKVWLVAQGGTTDVAGTIAANAPGGGRIETSGQTVDVGKASLDAHGGTWLVDPDDLTIDATAANTIDGALNAGTNVVEQTTATGASGPGTINTAGNGDIIVAAPITWSTGAGLTLSAYRNIDVNASISSSSGGAINLDADNTGSGIGAVSFSSGALASTSGSVNILYNPAGNNPSSVNPTSYTAPTNYSGDVAGGGQLTAYMLVNTIYDLQNIENNLAGVYALSRDINASATSTWNSGAGFAPIGYGDGEGLAFTGTFDGRSHDISELFIYRPNSYYVGLFGSYNYSFGISRGIMNLTLSDEIVAGGTDVGGLVGFADGSRQGVVYEATLSNDQVTGKIIGSDSVGGLAGELEHMEVTTSSSDTIVSAPGGFGVGGLVASSYDGEIENSYSSGSVLGLGDVGGLAGGAGDDVVSSSKQNIGFIINSYSTASVTIPTALYGYAGGLVGSNSGGIANSYSTGKVTVVGGCGASSNCNVGALVGMNAAGSSSVLLSSYYDVQTGGQSLGVGGAGASQAGASGLTTKQFMNPANFSGFTFGGLGSGATWVVIDKDGTLNGTDGATRPLLLSEYSTTVTNAHQLQLMTLAPTASYTFAGDVDASGTSSPADVWGAAGFVPIGSTSAPFTGVLNGQGYSISGLSVTSSAQGPASSYVGLFADTRGTIANLNITDATVVAGAQAVVGVVAGENDGVISNVRVAGSVLAGNSATGGGVAGYNTGTISNTASAAAVRAGTSSDLGGIAGDNTGTVSGSNATGLVSSGYSSDIGGLVGYSRGTISQSYAAGAVTASGMFESSVGGLVGRNDTGGSVSSSYATGAVSLTNGVGAATGDGDAGGLAGDNIGTISAAYATGAVSGASDASLGGLIGFNYAPYGGTIANAYYDQGTTGRSVGVGGSSSSQGGVTAIGGNTGLSPYSASTYKGFTFGGLGSSASWVIVDSGATLNGSNGATRPILLSEYSTTISNAHQLQLMALARGVTYTLAADVDASGTSNPADIWSPAGFVPVGSKSLPFTGTLDGQGETVSGLTIASPNASYVGLIGAVGGGGLVENVTLSGASVSGAANVGILAGYSAGTVSGASGKGAVSGSSAVGGLVGYNSGAISGSSGKATVSSPASVGSELGGLVGVNTGQLTGDYATGAVTGNTRIGGLAGVNTGTISGDYATGAVDGASGKTSSGAGSAIGGLVGDNENPIMLSHASGAVTGYDDVGGLIGLNQEGGQILSSYATGAVSGASGANTPSGSGARIGGLIGEDVAAEGLSDTYATGAVSGVTQVGGLIGDHDASGAVEQSFATGKVSGTSAIGGLVGYNNNEIANSYATGAVSGMSGKGGLVGVDGVNGRISTSYATGAGGSGFVGVNEGQGSLSDDVFDEGAAGTNVGVGSGDTTGVTAIGGSTGRSPYAASSYAGFDFTNIWSIDASSSRPFLLDNPQSPPPS